MYNNQKISIVMAVYNGAEYLYEQLDSIRWQTIEPHEVLIYDDFSEDNSFELIEEYINANNLLMWKIIRNDKNYGWKHTFAKGICSAAGDLIFTCDQDDCWFADKLEVMSKLMAENPQIGVLVSEYEPYIMGEESYGITEKMKNSDGLHRAEQIKFDDHWFNIRYPGCVFCIKKEMTEFFSKYWFEGYAHDFFLWHIGILLGKLYKTDYVSIRFRRHGNTATGHRQKNLRDRLAAAQYHSKIYSCLSVFVSRQGLSENVIEQFSKSEEFFSSRQAMLEHFTVKNALRVLKNIKYYRLKNYLGDLHFIFCKK